MAYSLKQTDNPRVKAICRDDVHVANWDAEAKSVTILPGCESFGSAIKRWCNQNNIETDGDDAGAEGAGNAGNAGDETPGAQTPEQSPPVVAPEDNDAGKTTVLGGSDCNAAPEPGAFHLSPKNPGTAFVPHKHPHYPDGPDLDPMLGTKTPAFVEWLENKGAKRQSV